MVYSIEVDPDGFPVITVSDPLPVIPPPVVSIPPAVYVPPPSPADLHAFLGWPAPNPLSLDTERDSTAQAHLDRALLVVLAYTRQRGRYGGHLTEDLAQIVLSVAARSMNNPTGDSQITAGAYTARPGQPDFLLHELLVLQNYRRRAA